MNPLYGIWREKKQMQWCARFVHDLLYITFPKKHNSWQQQQDVICLVFTNSHESERMFWAKGVPFASYLRASECLQLGKAFDETYGTGSMRNSMSRKPAAGAVASGESSDIDVRGQNKKKKNKNTNNKPHNFFSREDCIECGSRSLWKLGPSEQGWKEARI